MRHLSQVLLANEYFCVVGLQRLVGKAHLFAYPTAKLEYI